jgi:hypothetical protein
LDTPGNIQARVPTDREMDFISTKDAEWRWGPVTPGARNRIWSVAGSTVRVLFAEILSPFRAAFSLPIAVRIILSQYCSVFFPPPATVWVLMLMMICSRVLLTLSGYSTIPCNVRAFAFLVAAVDPSGGYFCPCVSRRLTYPHSSGSLLPLCRRTFPRYVGILERCFQRDDRHQDVDLKCASHQSRHLRAQSSRGLERQAGFQHLLLALCVFIFDRRVGT